VQRMLHQVSDQLEYSLCRLQPDEDGQCAGCAEAARKFTASGDQLPPTSAKIQMMMKLLRDIDTRSEGQEKTIVFSQFTTFLDLLEPFLKHGGIKYVRCEWYSMSAADGR
jgi:SNF2 family DNA or RNA helicase